FLTSLAVFPSVARGKIFYTKSGNPELHSGLPCGAALGVPAALTLSFAPTMCPLQCPRPSPPADAGIRLLCSGPCDVGTYGRRRRREIRIFKKISFL
ncbi:unnamed protein product, partial [Staurois parvus]